MIQGQGIIQNIYLQNQIRSGLQYSNNKTKIEISRNYIQKASQQIVLQKQIDIIITIKYTLYEIESKQRIIIQDGTLTITKDIQVMEAIQTITMIQIQQIQFSRSTQSMVAEKTQGIAGYRDLGKNKIILYMTNYYASMQIQESNDYQITIIVWEQINITQYQIQSIKERQESQSASMKYILQSALTSSMIIQGQAQTYGITGTTNMNIIALYNTIHETNTIAIRNIISVQLQISIMMKQGQAPIHNWVPDLYRKLSAVNMLWFTIMPKMTIQFLQQRLYDNVLIIADSVNTIQLISAILSIQIGTIGQGSSNRLPRIQAYSGISQLGYIIQIQVTIQGKQIYTDYLYYIIIYGMTSQNLMAVYIAIPAENNSIGMENKAISGLYQRNRGQGCSQVVSIQSQAGIPPMAGFYSKQILQITQISSELYLIIQAIMQQSTISVYFYLSLINQILFTPFAKNNKNTKSLAVINSTSSYTIGIQSTTIVLFPLVEQALIISLFNY